MTAKTMIMGDELPAGSQIAKQDITQRRRLRMSVLRRPIMSATSPAKKRPKKEPPLRIARIWKPNWEEWPWVLAKDVM